MNQYFKLLTKNTDIKIDEIKTCKYCSDKFALTSLEKQLLDKHKFKYPENCPMCTFKILYSHINSSHLYHRKDTEDGKKLISTFSEDYKGEVLEANKYKKYLLDDFGLKYTKEISENIFPDFKKLYKDFPKASRLIFANVENGDYSHYLGISKNVYLSYLVFGGENVYCSFHVLYSKNIFRSSVISESQYIYNSGIITNSYGVSYSYNIIDSSRLIFCTNIQNSQDCIFCCNQVNTSYKIFNKQYSKEEYEKAKKDILDRLKDSKEFKKLQKLYNDFLEKNLVEQSTDIQTSEKVVGDTLYNSKNCSNVFGGMGLENTVNIMFIGDYKDDTNYNLINSMSAGTRTNNMIGACCAGIDVSGTYFSYALNNSKDIYYSIDIENCENCMFCVGLKNTTY